MSMMPLMDFTTDLPALYAIFGASVTWTPAVGLPKTAQAMHTQPGTANFGGESYSTEHTVRYMTSVFPSVKKGDVFTIFGHDYLVTDAPLATQDGAEHIATLAKKS